MNAPLHFLALGLPTGMDWLFIAALALLFFGVNKMPLIARSLGRGVGEFTKIKDEIKRTLLP